MAQLEIRKTVAFTKWIEGLRDIRARARILVRIERLLQGNPGDVKAVGEGITELRIDYGPGYWVYYKQIGHRLIVLLTDGDKYSQSKDIKFARRLGHNL